MLGKLKEIIASSISNIGGKYVWNRGK